MRYRVALVRADVSEERIASIVKVERLNKLGTRLKVTSNRSRLRRNTNYGICSSDTSIVVQVPHGIASQKTAFFIVTAEKTSDTVATNSMPEKASTTTALKEESILKLGR
jgi:hypothetical protein